LLARFGLRIRRMSGGTSGSSKTDEDCRGQHRCGTSKKEGELNVDGRIEASSGDLLRYTSTKATLKFALASIWHLVKPKACRLFGWWACGERMNVNGIEPREKSADHYRVIFTSAANGLKAASLRAAGALRGPAVRDVGYAFEPYTIGVDRRILR
jgi:hypothetical protein